MKRVQLWLVLLVLTTPLSSQVLINETYTGTEDAFELINLGSTTASLTGWRVEFGGLNPSLVWTAGTFFFPTGAAIAADQIIVVREVTSGPPVTPGTTVYTTGANINWATTGGGQTRGGSCILLDGSSQPVDMVRWLGAIPPNQFGGTFNGTYSPNSTSFGRVDFTDNNDGSDWGDDSLNLGSLSAAQQALFNVLDVTLTTTGVGDIAWTVVTSNPAVPLGEIYNLVSFQDFTPNGSGPLFGVGFDAVLLIGQPVSATNPFHTNLDATGQWGLALPFGIPLGLHVESVSILLGPGGISRISNTVATTF